MKGQLGVCREAGLCYRTFLREHQADLLAVVIGNNVTCLNITRVIGYYILSAGSISFNNLPAELQKTLPRYPIPIARIGRLASDKSVQGQGLGKYLLMDALYRCAHLTKEIGIVGVVVDAKHEKAKTFYQPYGLVELTNSPMTLFMPIQTIITCISR